MKLESDEDELMDIVDSSDKGNGSGDDLDYNEWWQYEACPFNYCLSTGEYLYH